MAANIDQLKTEKRAHWENRTCDVIRNKRAQEKFGELHQQRADELLDAEQAAYEREMVERQNRSCKKRNCRPKAKTRRRCEPAPGLGVSTATKQ